MPIPADTHPEAYEVQIRLIRQMGPDRKFSQIVQLCEDARELIIEGIRNRHPDYDEERVHQAAYRIFIGDHLYCQAWPDRPLLNP